MSTDTMTPRLGLVDPSTAEPAIAEALAKLPAINVFRALANATTLYPPLAELLSLVFRPVLEIELERMIVLRVAKLQDCAYAWRRNVVVARGVGVTDFQIAALDRGDVTSPCFSPAQQAAFALADEVIHLIEATDATYERAKQFFSDRAITEILFVIRIYMFVARVLRTGRVPLDADLAPPPA